MSYDYDTNFGTFGVPTEQHQPTGYSGVDPYYVHEPSNLYGSSLVLCNDGRAVRSTPGMAPAHMYAGAGGDQRLSSYSDQQLPLSVYSDGTMTIDDHTRYHSAFMSSNAHVSLVSPGGNMEEHPNAVCDSRNAQRQRLHNVMTSDPLSSGSFHDPLSASLQSDGADAFSFSHDGNCGVDSGFGHMVTGMGGGVDNGGGGFTDTEFNQLMEQICSPDAGGDPLLPQCSPVEVFSEETHDILRRVNVEQQLSGGEQIIQDLEAFQATDIQFQQSATIYGDFLKAPVQVNPSEAPSSEPRSLTINSVESEPQSIEHDLEIMTLMRTKKQTKKKTFPPQSLALSEQASRNRGRDENIAVTTCTPAQVKMEFVSPTSSQQVPDFNSLPQTPLSSKAPYGMCSQPPITPVQVSAPSPAPPQTPVTPSPPVKKGLYEIRTFHENNNRCLTLSIRTDIPDDARKVAYQASAFSCDLSNRYKACLDRQFELNMALNKRAKMCSFDFNMQTGEMFFSMPVECMQLDKWLSVHQGDEDLLERQMVVQQVANFLADIHGCGSADKLCLWGSFVVWVTRDTQVYILVDFPDMLTKMEREQMNHGFDPRVEDVKALYKLYNEIFEPHIKQGSSWISPGVTNLLLSFEALLCDPTSVYRMAELARMFGERRLCKLEVDIMSLVHTTYCIEHEKLNNVLSHFREMLPSSVPKWQVQWTETGKLVAKDVVAVAQKQLRLRFVPVEGV